MLGVAHTATLSAHSGAVRIGAWLLVEHVVVVVVDVCQRLLALLLLLDPQRFRLRAIRCVSTSRKRKEERHEEGKQRERGERGERGRQREIMTHTRGK